MEHTESHTERLRFEAVTKERFPACSHENDKEAMFWEIKNKGKGSQEMKGKGEAERLLLWSHEGLN